MRISLFHVLNVVRTDVLVHRQLLSSLESTKGASVLNNEEVSDLAAHINRRHRASKNTQKDSSALFQTIFFRNRKNDVLIISSKPPTP
jgi:exoribonuclease R